MLLPLLLVLTACVPKAQYEESLARQALLEGRVSGLETRLAALESASAGAPSGTDETAAAALVREATDAYARGDVETARAKLAELKQKYPGARATRSAKRLQDEIEIVGMAAGEIEVDRWFTPSSAYMGDGVATLLVFWEQWCPHCKREIPRLQARYEKYQPSGLSVVALTKVTKSSTDESVDAFILDQGLGFPVGKENGAMSSRFGVRGIPAAAVVKNGVVVWRGHPAKIEDAMIDGWLGL